MNINRGFHRQERHDMHMAKLQEIIETREGQGHV
jgi:hypothetical protein